MATSQKVHVILTKCFMCINWEHNVIYLQNMKFEKLNSPRQEEHTQMPTTWHKSVKFL